MQRRRKATADELAQGQKEMLEAQRRLEREREESGELALEDAEQKPKKVGPRTQGTPSTTAKASIEDAPTQAASTSSAVRTPEALGPKEAKGGGSAKKEVKLEEEEGRSSRPTPASSKVKAGGREEGLEEVKSEGKVEEHSISTPPDVRQPLFDEEQVQDFQHLYEQAPWLYSKFETPKTSMSLQRPAFLKEEEGKTEELRLEEEKKRQQIMMALEERRNLERAGMVAAYERRKEYDKMEKEEMNRQIQFLILENQQLREGFDVAVHEKGVHERSKQDEEGRKSKQVKKLLEENLQLKSRLHSLAGSLEEGKVEDETTFATPNGSTGQEESGAAREEEKNEGNEERRGKGKGSRKEEPKTDSLPPQTVEVILKLMEGMQEIQKKLIRRPGEDSEEAEVVRHSVELPKLQEWSAESGPIDYADWLLLLQPIMSDLSASSEEWWSQMVVTAREWYSSHMLKTPLDRLAHSPVPGPGLLQKKWSRLERRASALLLAAIPEGLREEVVSSKSITTLGILAKGMVQYQPGGLAERTAILTALECPTEASTVGSAIAILRRWQRWKRRAEELQVSIPDPTILAKGLSRLVKKLTVTYPELSFRLQLVKSALMVDAVPSHDSITKYSEHLMAELEQVNQQSRKRESPGSTEVPKIKKFEEGGKEKKEVEKEKREGDSKDKGKCRFFLTDQGCRRGKSCSYSHEARDDRRRCWNCGGVDHMSPQCQRPKEGKDAAKPKVAKIEKGKEEGRMEEVEGLSSPPTMKELLDEANKVLKSLAPPPTSQPPKISESSGGVKGSTERQEVVDRLQAQLNALRKFRLRKMRRNDRAGLLDSGATHYASSSSS